MTKLYKPFFMLYGGMHVAAGAAIAFWPPILDPVLMTPAEPGAATLLGFLSTMAGAAFVGAAFVGQARSKLMFVAIAAAANVVNLVAHASNALRGLAPTYMIPVAGAAIALMLAILFVIARDLKQHGEA